MSHPVGLKENTKKTSDDLQVARQQLKEPRYNAKSNVFVTDRPDCTEFEPAEFSVDI